MNENRKEELLTRWVDGDLSADELRELEPYLAKHPELARERDEYVRLRDELKAAVPAEVDPPYPEFFNVHLQRMIEESMLSSGGRSESKPGLSRLWTWWMAPAAAAALVAAFVAGMKLTPSGVPAPVVGTATALYSPVESVQVEAMVDEDLDATVIVLTGLEEIADQDLMGWSGSQGVDDHFLVSTSHSF